HFVELQQRYLLDSVVHPISFSDLAIVIGCGSYKSFQEREAQQSVLYLFAHRRSADFLRGLKTLGGSQNVHALVVGELGHTFRVHWPTTLSFSAQCLTTLTRVNHHQHLSGANWLEHFIQIEIRYSAGPYLLRCAGRKVERQQIKSFADSDAVSSVVDDDRILRLDCFKSL